MNYNDMPLEQLWEYRPHQTREPDFDAFWDKTLADSKEQPINAGTILTDSPIKQARVYDVFYDGFLNSRLHGRLVMPEGASRFHKVSAVVMNHGYNYNNMVITNALPYVLAGYAVFLCEARGQSVQSPDDNTYSNGGAAGWMTLGLRNPLNYYYRYVYMDCVRVVNYLCSRDDIDKTKIAATGVSQGGGLSLAIAALAPQVSVVMADVPFLCNFRNSVLKAADLPYMEFERYFGMFDSLHKTENDVYRTLSYFDNLNLCTRIKADVLMGVGLEDVICPPSSSFAVFNNILSRKEMRVYPDFGHGGFSLQEDEKLTFLAKRFG